MVHEDINFSNKRENSDINDFKSQSLFIEAHADDANTIEDKKGQSLLGLGKLKKRAQTLKAMSSNLTNGGGELLGGITNLSKDVINKL